MRPPEIVVGVGGIAAGDDRVRLSRHVDGNDLDGVQIVGSQSQLPAQESERTPGNVPAHADERLLTEGDDHVPVPGQLAEGLADGGAGLDGDRASLRVMIDALHRRDVEDDASVAIGDEAFQAVPTRW